MAVLTSGVEQFLDRANVVAVFEEMRRTSVGKV